MSTKKAANVLVAATPRRLVTEFEVSLRPKYNVWSTTSGRQALDILDNEVDVVVVSTETTDMKGTKVVSETRARGIDCKTAVVGRKEANEVFDGYVPTPVTPDGIAATVEKLSEKQRRPAVLKKESEMPESDNPVAEDYEKWESNFERTDNGGFSSPFSI
jgi:DNA-binding NtrC family response regulator